MTGATDGPATLIDRLYTVPGSGGVVEEKEEEEGEAHRRYKRELMKYRRTAKVVKLYPVVLCASLLVNWSRWCILCTRNTVERLLVTSRHSIGCVVYV